MIFVKAVDLFDNNHCQVLDEYHIGEFLGRERRVQLELIVYVFQ